LVREGLNGQRNYSNQKLQVALHLKLKDNEFIPNHSDIVDFALRKFENLHKYEALLNELEMFQGQMAWELDETLEENLEQQK
jgi:hypothetical protein